MSEATVAALTRAARRVFASHGYAEAPIDEIVRPLGLTKGALYHHFGSKQGLLAAVVRSIDAEIEAEIEEARAAHPAPWAQFWVSLRLYIDALARPENARIVLLDAPAVFGIQASRDYDRDSTIRQLREALLGFQEAGQLGPLDAEVCAHLLNGAIIEAAFWVAEQPERSAALDRVMSSLAQLLRGLRAP